MASNQKNARPPGTPPDALRKSKAIGDAVLFDWLERFQKRASAPTTPTSTDWPRWRGPNADGIAESRNKSTNDWRSSCTKYT